MSSRLYPARPIVGVGGVIIADGCVVLIKRRYEPLAGQWSLPGGSLEVGESLADGACRELREETGLIVDVGPIVEVFDRIVRDEDGRVRYHFVLVDFLCRPIGGTLEAADDVSDARWVSLDGLTSYGLTEKATSVIGLGQRLLETGNPWNLDGHP